MSDAFAIGATSAVLRRVLRTGMEALNIDDALAGGPPRLTVGAPDRVVLQGQEAALNIFLYSVQRNTGWANRDLPARDPDGRRVSAPALGLDLSYLLTAYGSADLEAETLLGGAMQVLQEIPGLDRPAIREALDVHPAPDEVPAQLRTAGLADQYELLRISPLPMPSDEISRLWTAFQSPYRPSVAYTVSVVLIESARPARQALPVRRRAVYVVPFRELRVDRVVSAAGPETPIAAGSSIRILGRQLGAADLRVLVNGIDMTARVTARDAGEVRLDLGPLPPNPPALPQGMRAGPAGVQIVKDMAMGDPPVAHGGFASNVGAFVLAPRVAPALNGGAIDVDTVPPIGRSQRVRLLLNQINPAAGQPPRAYSFPAPGGNGIVPPATETNSVSIGIPGVQAGSYLVRLQVDGAESALEVDGNGHFAQPVVAVP